MSHIRKDSAMTHSTRISYKDKLQKLQADRTYDVSQAVETLSIQSDVNTNFVAFQAEIHDLVNRVATSAKSAVEILDEYSYCEGLAFKKSTHQIDDSLLNMNVGIMLRRSNDIIKKLTDRVALLSEAYNESKKGLDLLLVQTSLLSTPIRHIKEQTLETVLIGRQPSDEEKAIVEVEGECNRYNLTYETDTESDTEDEEEGEDETKINNYALTLRK